MNEDDFIVDDRRRVWAVADGMGGHAAGDEASATIVDALRHVRASWRSAKALAEDVIGRIEDAHVAIRRETAATGRGQAGSTVVCLAAFGAHALITWCGDSRVYRRRAALGPAALTRITRDHTVVQALIDDGRLTEIEAERHPQAHVLTRAVGVDGAMDLDFRQLDILGGDRFLLCSDGLTRVVPEAAIDVALARATTAEACADALIAAALEAGGPDNVTVVVVDFL